MSRVRAHKPSGRPSPPFVLVEGEEKAGKTWAMCELSASTRVGAMYILELGEFTVEEYGAIPGVRFEVLDHDGSYHQVLDQIEAVREEALRAHASGEPPVVLGIDSMTDLWEGLSAWVDQRGRRFKYNAKRLAEDPDAEVVIPPNLWNDANGRHNKVMKLLNSFPGIVVVTARGGEVAEVKNGRPVEGSKIYRARGQKDLAYGVRQWIRLTRGNRPQIIGARAVQPDLAIRPGDPAVTLTVPDGSSLLDWLIFDAWKFDPAIAQVAEIRNLTGGDLTPDERVDEAAAEEAGSRIADRRYGQRQSGTDEPEAETRNGQRSTGVPADQELAEQLAELAALCTDVEKLRRTWDEASNRHLLLIDVRGALTDAQVEMVAPGSADPMIPLRAWLLHRVETVTAAAGSPTPTPDEPGEQPAEPATDPTIGEPIHPAHQLALTALTAYDLDQLTDLMREAQTAGALHVDCRPILSPEHAQVLALGDGDQPTPLGAVMHATRRHLTTGDGRSANDAASDLT